MYNKNPHPTEIAQNAANMAGIEFSRTLWETYKNWCIGAPVLTSALILPFLVWLDGWGFALKLIAMTCIIAIFGGLALFALYAFLMTGRVHDRAYSKALAKAQKEHLS